MHVFVKFYNSESVLQEMVYCRAFLFSNLLYVFNYKDVWNCLVYIIRVGTCSELDWDLYRFFLPILCQDEMRFLELSSFTSSYLRSSFAADVSSIPIVDENDSLLDIYSRRYKSIYRRSWSQACLIYLYYNWYFFCLYFCQWYYFFSKRPGVCPNPSWWDERSSGNCRKRSW